MNNIFFFLWFIIFTLLPSIAIYLLMVGLHNYQTHIPWAVLVIIVFPVCIIVSFNYDLKNSITRSRYLTLKQTIKLDKFVNMVKPLFNLCVNALIVIFAIIIASLIIFETLDAQIVYTALAAIFGAELYIVVILAMLKAKLANFFTAISV